MIGEIESALSCFNKCMYIVSTCHFVHHNNLEKYSRTMKIPSQCACANVRFLLRLSHTCISSIGVVCCKLFVCYAWNIHANSHKKTNICNMYSRQRWVQKTEVLHKRCLHTIHYSILKFGGSIWQENLTNDFVIPHFLYLGKNISVINLPNSFSPQLFVPYSTYMIKKS